MEDYIILAFYCYVDIEDPEKEVKDHHAFLKNLNARARLYIAYNGLNGQMSFLGKDAEKYIEWLKADSRFRDTQFKIDPYHEHIYPRVTVKIRRQLVALDYLPDMTKRGTPVEPKKWAQMLEEKDENTLLIDVRNDYESAIGKFEGAECPKIKKFREFPAYAEALAKRKDPKKTRVMMYCTGGIRCETYSALLKEKGFEEVYQLEGGVINYGHKMGNRHWEGKLFVFDDRLSVPLSEDEHKLISHCSFCSTPSDAYYNCANMDCNELFLACPDCAEKRQGCCCPQCAENPRRRPFEKTDRPKPFRKWYHYIKAKTECPIEHSH